MKNNDSKILLTLLAVFALAISSCYKKIDIPNTNTVEVALASGANYVTTDMTVKPKDSIIFSYTITSNTDMKYVGIQKNATDNSTFVANTKDTLSAANKNNYTATKRLAADSASGTYKFRVVALDVAGLYLGSREVIITVTPDFNYYTVRVLQVPDTTAKTNNCYMAASTGMVYSYTSSGAANSASIDFGFYYDTTTANKFSVYALSAPQVQLSYYDISTWTKNATIMKKATTPTFTSITSGGALRTAAITNLSSGTTNKITALAAGNLVFFKTVAGKTGCIQVNYINGTDASKTSYMNLDVKIEK
jgi:hypothetical protein